MDEVDGKEEPADVPSEAPNGADQNTEDDGTQQKPEVKAVDDEALTKKEAKVEEADPVAVNETNGIEEESPPETRDWADLSMLEKLESVHTVMEWHFQNPLRLRGIMRSDDDTASWVSQASTTSLFVFTYELDVEDGTHRL